MAARKPVGDGGRATLRDVLAAVEGVYGRVDEVYERVSDAHDRIDGIVKEQARGTVALVELRACVNDQLHQVRGDIRLLKRPWTLLGAAANIVSRRALLIVGAAVGALVVQAVIYMGWPL